MKLYSENIKRYIMNNTNFDLNQEIEQAELYKIKELNINKLNYKMEEAVFIPEELKYFKGIEKIEFSGFDINDKLIANLNELENLRKISFDHCNYNCSKKLTVKLSEIYMNHSNINLLYICKNMDQIEKILLNNINEIDMKILIGCKNLKELIILNSDIVNSNELAGYRSVNNVQIIGGNIDDCKIIDKLKETINISYKACKFYNIG